MERFLGGAAKCSRASTRAEKHVGGSLHALQLKWRTGALWFWWAPAQFSGFKASQFQPLPGASFCQLIVRINRKLVQVVRSVGAKSTQQVEQSWTMQQPLACKEALANMHGRFSAESVEAPELLLGLSKFAFSTIVGLTGLCCPALPSWQQWKKLDPACFENRRYHLGSDGGSSMVDASRHPTLPSWQHWRKLDRTCF